MKSTNTLQYKNYICQVTFYNVHNCLVGKVLGMSQIRSFQAETVKGIKAEFHRAVDDYLTICEETGKKPAQAFTGNLTIRTTPAVHEALSLYAADQQTTLAQVISLAMVEFLENHDIELPTAGGEG